MVKRILEDKEHKKLLDILEPQLKLLIEKGTPDLAAFFENLVDSRLVTDNELRELQVEFPLESVSGLIHSRLGHRLTSQHSVHSQMRRWTLRLTTWWNSSVQRY
jgi:hypothetical protein